MIFSEGKIENKKKERRKEEKKKKEEVETSDEECIDTQGKAPFNISYRITGSGENEGFS